MSKIKMSTAQAKQERQWQVDNALSTLQRADQIKKDKPLMAQVRKAASELQRAVGQPSRTPKKKK